MYLTKLLIRDFGLFHNTSVDLEPGINMIVGDDGTGKSTFRDFIVGLIYGIPRREGITKVRSNYEKRKPEDRAGYSGTAYIKKDGKTYLLDRTFLAGAKKASVMDVAEGREVNLEYPDTLSGTLCTTDKNTFLDTKCIAEESADATGLQEYLTNITLTGTSNINKQKAIKYLENEKKSHVPKPLIRRLDELSEKMDEYETVDQDIDKLEDEIKKLNEEFIMEAERRKRAARKMVENEDGTVSYETDEEIEAQIDRITEKHTGVASEKLAEEAVRRTEEIRKEQKKNVKFTDRVSVIIATGLFVIGVIAAIVYILPFADMVRLLFVLFTAVFVFITIIQGFRLKGYFGGESGDALPDEEEFRKVLEELQAEAEKEEEVEIDMTFAKEYQEKKNDLTNALNAQIERRNQRNKLRVEFDNVFKKKSELEAEIKAIDYAISKINSLSNDFRKEAFNRLLGNISIYVKKLTLGRFNRLSFDERGNCILVNDEGVLPITALTDEDAAIVYLAVRLSIAKFLSRESMPLIIDGTSALTTAAEVKAFADCLVDMKEEQIILLTADMGMYSVFMSKGIEVNRVAL